MSMKICTKCELEKPIYDFKKHRLHKDGIYSHCKDCVKKDRSNSDYKQKANVAKRENYKRPEIKAAYRKWNDRYRSTEHGRGKVNNYFLNKLYGITIEKYNEMFLSQNRCCAICSMDQSLLTKRLCVDHNHETGEIRALLCSSCNTAIGLFKENESLLLKAIGYLNKHKPVKLKLVGED